MVSYAHPQIGIVLHEGNTYVFDRDIDVPDEIESSPGSGRIRQGVDNAYGFMFHSDESYYRYTAFFKPDVEWDEVKAWSSFDESKPRLIHRTPQELLADTPSPPLTEFETEVREGMIKIMNHRWWGWPSVQQVKQGRTYTVSWGNLLTNILLVLWIPVALYCSLRNIRDRFFLYRFSDLSCNKCGYSTEGLPSPVCPECGTEFGQIVEPETRAAA